MEKSLWGQLREASEGMSMWRWQLRELYSLIILLYVLRYLTNTRGSRKRHILRGIAIPLLGKCPMTCSHSCKVLIYVCKFWALIIVYCLKFLVPEISCHWEFKYCRHLRRVNAIVWLQRNLDFCNQQFYLTPLTN